MNVDVVRPSGWIRASTPKLYYKRHVDTELPYKELDFFCTHSR